MGSRVTAALAALGLVISGACYMVKGAIPDALLLLDTTLVGGYLGLAIPFKNQN